MVNMALNLTGMSGSVAGDSQTARVHPKLHPITGKPIQFKTPRVTMPLVGKGVAITDQLGEVNARKEKLEMMNYQ